MNISTEISKKNGIQPCIKINRPNVIKMSIPSGFKGGKNIKRRNHKITGHDQKNICSGPVMVFTQCVHPTCGDYWLLPAKFKSGEPIQFFPVYRC